MPSEAGRVYRSSHQPCVVGTADRRCFGRRFGLWREHRLFARALPLLGDAPFLVVNGDVLIDIDFAAAHRKASLLPEHISAHLWLVENPPHHPDGDFLLLPDGSVRPEVSGGNGLTFSGVGIYRPEMFDGIEAGSVAKLAPVLRNEMRQNRVSGQKYTGLWLDVGTVDRLKEAQAVAGAWK